MVHPRTTRSVYSSALVATGHMRTGLGAGGELPAAEQRKKSGIARSIDSAAREQVEWSKR